MSQYNDEQTQTWIRQAREGKESALAAIIRFHDTPLKGYIRGQIFHTVRDQDSVEEIAQEVWIDVARDIGKTVEEGGYDENRASFYTYIINRYALFKVLQWKERFHKLAGREKSFNADSEDSVREYEPEGAEPTPLQRIMAEEASLSGRLTTFELLMNLLFLCGGYPYQQIAFGLSKHIFGRENEQGVQGWPEKVDQAFGRRTLKESLDIYWKRYAEKSRIDSPDRLKRLEKSLDPCRRRLTLTVSTWLEKDKASQKAMRKILDRVGADSCLAVYYENRLGGFTTAIPDWSYKVESRVKKVFEDRTGACTRCKLKHLPPCRSD